MPVERLLPTEEGGELIALVRQIAEKELRPRVDQVEAAAAKEDAFPRDIFAIMGAAGLMSLPYPLEYGGAEQPYEVYLQVLEELSTVWMAAGLGVSVHTLTCYPVVAHGTPEQKRDLLPAMLSGETLGAYGLSEPHAGSDIGSMSTRARRDGEHYVITGKKSWISHAGHADFYTTFARTSDTGGRGLSCFVVPADAAGLSFGAPERTMGLHGDTVREVIYEDVRIPAVRRIGEEGAGMAIALAGLDSGRLGIAAGATGLAQGALDLASRYAVERRQFGRPIASNQGLAFMIADMAAAVASARATYLYAARLRDAGRPFSKEAAVAKLVATDAAMMVSDNAVQVLGGAGYTQDFPAERYFREAKVTQIFEGTNQIQRLVIARHTLGM